MAKPTGFMEYKRKLPKSRTPEERLKDYAEFQSHLPLKKQQEQAARCMDCGIPFCHTGILIEGAASGCPIHNLIPEWNELIYKGLWKDAYLRLEKTNNFPEFTGRVCPAPCEGACTVGLNEEAVTIKENEVTLADMAFEEGWVKPFIPERRSGRTVAVIGSGPAGLACADQLNKAGHVVTVFERADRPGGLLMYGIPNMKLDKDVVLRRISIMEQSGITFKTGVEIGKDILLPALEKEYDAVVICTGATKPRDLNVEGRELEGTYFAVDFLTQHTQALLDQKSVHVSGPPEGALSVKDKHVIVVGGGDTGTDCVGTSLRHGAADVVQIEIMPKPPGDRPTNNPWPQWPKTLKTDYGQKEAAFVAGKDPRVWETTVQKIEGDASGRVKAVHTVEVKWVMTPDGRRVPEPVEGTQKRLQADVVLLAMGFLGPEDTVLKDKPLKRDGRSNIEARYGEYSTSEEKIFVAGDARRGQSLIVWAINEGRGAAARCDYYLNGFSSLPL